MTTKISHVRLRVQINEPTPPGLIETYMKGVMKSPDKVYKQLKKVIPDIEAVIEKILKPAIKGSKGLFKPEAFTRRGTKIKDSFRHSRADLVKWARKYLKKRKYAFRHEGKEYAEVMEVMSGIWGEKMTWFVLPFSGFGDKIRGVGPIVAQWLTGILTVLKKINPKEIIKRGPIDITQPGQGGKFRKRLNSQILEFGSQVIKKKFDPREIIYANEQINRLVNEFARDEFVPFTPGGESHVDFMIGDDALFLDVQVSTK